MECACAERQGNRMSFRSLFVQWLTLSSAIKTTFLYLGVSVSLLCSCSIALHPSSSLSFSLPLSLRLSLSCPLPLSPSLSCSLPLPSSVLQPHCTNSQAGAWQPPSIRHALECKALGGEGERETDKNALVLRKQAHRCTPVKRSMRFPWPPLLPP